MLTWFCMFLGRRRRRSAINSIDNKPTTRTFNVGTGAGPFSALQVLRLATARVGALLQVLRLASAGVCTLLSQGERGLRLSMPACVGIDAGTASQ
jgi:hypothetical protein